MKFLAFTLICASAFAQNTAVFPARAATTSDLKIATNRSDTTLTQNLDAVSLTLNVAATTGFTFPALVTVDSEIMNVCSKSSNTFTVCASGRGFDGSTATTHLSGAHVTGRMDAWHHNQMAAEVMAIEGKLNSESLNIRDFGAKCDSDITGSGTDDTAAIQAALNWATSPVSSSATAKSYPVRRELSMPMGICRISSLTLNDSTVPSTNVITNAIDFHGQGKKGTILVSTATSGNVFTVGQFSGNGARIHDFSLYGPNSGTGALPGAGSTTATGIYNQFSNDTVYSGLAVFFMQDGFSSSGAIHFTIRDSFFQFNLRDGIHVDAPFAARLNNNFSQTNGRYGIWVSAANGADVTGNTMGNNTTQGFYTSGSSGVNLTGNYFESNGVTDADGILNASAGLTMSGNYFLHDAVVNQNYYNFFSSFESGHLNTAGVYGPYIYEYPGPAGDTVSTYDAGTGATMTGGCLAEGTTDTVQCGSRTAVPFSLVYNKTLQAQVNSTWFSFGGNLATSAAHGALDLVSTDPSFRMRSTGATSIADKRTYEWRVISDNSSPLSYMQLRKINDAQSVFTNLLQIWNSGGMALSTSGSVDPGAGNLRIDGVYTSAGSAGMNVTKTIRAAGGVADCTLIYAGGLLVGGSC